MGRISICPHNNIYICLRDFKYKMDMEDGSKDPFHKVVINFFEYEEFCDIENENENEENIKKNYKN